MPKPEPAGLGFLLLTARIRAAAGDLTREKAAALLHNLLVASYSLLFCLRKTLLPLDLSALYPYPDQVGPALPWSYLAAPAAMVIQMAISCAREYGADGGGTMISGNPRHLANALRKLHAASRGIPVHANPATAHMFIVSPLSGGGIVKLFSTHPPMEERIARLESLSSRAEGGGIGRSAVVFSAIEIERPRGIVGKMRRPCRELHPGAGVEWQKGNAPEKDGLTFFPGIADVIAGEGGG